jgi:hypothetical protein
MTHVTIYRNEKNECIGFNVIGHAEQAEAGQDIVCAAVSMLVINTCNAIEKFTESEFTMVTNEKAGLIDCRLKDAPSDKTELLFSTMILGISSLAEDEDYKKYIRILFEEV